MVLYKYFYGEENTIGNIAVNCLGISSIVNVNVTAFCNRGPNSLYIKERPFSQKGGSAPNRVS
jgi:hypothetical protein